MQGQDFPDARIKPKQKVVLYVYDHCPFCIRARFILGYKKIFHDVIFLANDDFDTPIGLCGKKAVPIMKVGDRVIPESGDIIRYVDTDPDEIFNAGPPVVTYETKNKQKLNEILSAHSENSIRLLFPRVAKATLPEFSFKRCREVYILRHPLPEPSDYEVNFKNTPNLLKKLQEEFNAIDELMYSEEFVGEEGLSFDDIQLFGLLRCWSLIKDAPFTTKMRKYMNAMADKTDMYLFSDIAL